MKTKTLSLILGMILLLALLPLISADTNLNPFATSKMHEKNITEDMSAFVKEGFNNEYGVIRLSSTFFWIEQDKIAEYSLTKNTKVCAANEPDGCEQIIKTTLYTNMSLFDKVEQEIIKGDNKQIDLKYWLLITEEYFIDVPIYKEVCEDILNKNTTKIENICSYVFDYNKKEIHTKQVYVPYDGKILSAGDYQYKITGTIGIGQTIDIIQTSDGKTFFEWETWTSADCKGTGGTVKIDGDYCVHTFTTNSSLNVTGTIDSEIANISVLVVAGGGGGHAYAGGGGGAGGLIYNNSYTSITGNNSVKVGLGGSGTNGGSGSCPGQGCGVSGGNSTFGLLDAMGGSGGSSENYANLANGPIQLGGSSGSGGGGTQPTISGPAYPGQGYAGGNNSGSTASPYPAGGGGGAGGLGGMATANSIAGVGGIGLNYSINGTIVCYAGGGGGGLYGAGTAGIGVCGGGNGVGGAGTATAGTNGTGGGGGGAGNGGIAKEGGSGIVIVRYLAGLTPDVALNISIFTPTTIIPYGYIGEPINLSYAINGTTCLYEYAATNYSIVCNQANSLMFNLTTQKNITLWASNSTDVMSLTRSWDYTVFQNAVIFNTSTYETASESFILNATGMTTASLVYNGSTYSPNVSGGIATSTVDIPATPGNKSFYWDINSGTITTTYYQYVNLTIFNLCNTTNNVPYINLTFKDEITDAYINAGIASSTWNYWLGDGSTTKTLTFSNITENPSYGFCLIPPDRTLHNTRTVQFSSTGYPARIYTASTDLTNSTTNKTLYLLGSGDGIYVTFYVVSSTGGSGISGVDVTASVSLGGISTVVGQGTTDSSGAVTFWLNPNANTLVTFTKSGCTPTTSSITPTSSTYAQTLLCGAAINASQMIYTATVDGVSFVKYPSSGVTSPGTITFSYTVYATNSNLENIKFELVNLTDDVLTSATTACGNSSFCQTSLVYTLYEGDNIKGKYYVDVGDGNGFILLEADAYWRFITINETEGTLKSFFTDLNSMFYTWGSDDSNCGQYWNNGTSCAAAGCKFITSSGATLCIPSDRVNKLEFSKIVLLFFLMALFIAALNKFTNVDSLAPGIAIYIVTILIWMGSLAGGVGGQGLFYYDGLYPGTSMPALIINNYILALTMSMLALGQVLSTLRRYT